MQKRRRKTTTTTTKSPERREDIGYGEKNTSVGDRLMGSKQEMG